MFLQQRHPPTRPTTLGRPLRLRDTRRVPRHWSLGQQANSAKLDCGGARRCVFENGWGLGRDEGDEEEGEGACEAE